MDYIRPLVQHGAARPDDALPLAGRADLWFSHAEVLTREGAPSVLPVGKVAPEVLERLTVPRVDYAGLSMDTPRIMGIVNTTPDSFSDGGRHALAADALVGAGAMATAGADILDIGGESTRPGAETVPDAEEIQRTEPVIAALSRDNAAVISIDTRKAAVGRAAVEAGAAIVNDVSGFTYDPHLADVAVQSGAAVCVMHALGDPATMQDDPQYDDVLLDVYDYLAERVVALEAMGIERARIAIDPGIGFGKTVEHNLALLRGLSLFHGLGCPILLGVSRKGFIGRIGQQPDAALRAPGSIALGLEGLAQGVQILRVHDVAETVQAVRLWQAVR
ncbi:dihydropteroate synthase [Arenibacterium halophilum]|uniref:Dihydropteroate synthase n=1 Tax=Arenibacterium halophilum TaxID=2583821 RepID=A0ABY2X9A9_9RHOB|nr:dihydropteroate synthase [Arenibacterium halophilum]TMV12960.1 dihydropteroate synthase [Arenibacterium halophilum]